MASLLSIQVGLPETHAWSGRPWRTGYFKQPVPGPVHVTLEALAGDGAASPNVHGGPDRVVLGYAASHYPGWREAFPEYDFPYGAFAENFTLEGLDEGTVCVGDRHHFGAVVLEVTMPRVPCTFISRGTRVQDLFDRVQETGKIGWLYRVIQGGDVVPGPVVVEPGPHAGWTVARTYELSRRWRRKDASALPELAELARCERLAADWRERMAESLAEAGVAF